MTKRTIFRSRAPTRSRYTTARISTGRIRRQHGPLEGALGRHGSGNDVSSTSTVGGDALPNGGGAWAKPGSNIWTPGAFYNVKKGVGRYYLTYTATKRKSGGRKCVGRALDAAVHRIRSRAEAARVPDEGRPLGTRRRRHQRADGEVWMTWRDGQRAQGPESALSAMRLKFRKNGNVDRGSRPRVIMRSNGLAWAHDKQGKNGVTVIENPSAFFNEGSWYLFYSGNKWQQNYYATGIAHCGPKLATDCAGRCRTTASRGSPMPHRAMRCRPTCASTRCRATSAAPARWMSIGHATASRG